MNQPPQQGYHMSPDDFRQHGHALVDWIADYYRRVEQFPVLSQVAPGAVRAQLPDRVPEHGEPFEQILADVERIVLPGLTHWQSPNFFGYFPGNSSGPAILGELMSAGLGVQGMLWTTSPACTELETHVMDWLVDLLGLPAAFRSSGAGGGVLQDSASSGALCALLAAREQATGGETNARGGHSRLVAYASSQAHSSIQKGVGIAGVGRDNLRLVPVDDRLAMVPESLAAMIRSDREAGSQPFFVCATVGTTSTNAMDPIRAIGSVCAAERLWLHVDAAMAGTAAVCPEFRHFQDGLELAASYCFNPHKWMFTNFDCDCLYVADRRPLLQALSILPEYLRNQASQSGAVLDYRDWQVPLGRRFRALKLWFVLRHYGVEGLRHHIRRHVALAQTFADWVRAHSDFELLSPPPLNLVCFRHRSNDDVNEALMNALNRSGRLFLTHTRIGGRFVLRFCVGQTHTEERHVRDAWERIQSAAAELRSHPSA